MTARGALKRRSVLGAASLFALALAWFVWQTVVAASLPNFNDETERLLVARLLIEGRALYSDIHVQHGPFNYALGHLWAYLAGTSEVLPYRLLQAGLIAGVAAATAFSPALGRPDLRLYAAAAALAGYGAILASTGLYLFQYQALGGLCLALFTVFVLLPALYGETAPPIRAAVGGAGLVFAGFNAYSFGIAMIFGIAAVLLASIPGTTDRPALWHRIRAPLIGGTLAFAAMVAWLLIFGDPAAFAVFHIYLNQAVYADFISFSPAAAITAIWRLRADAAEGLDLLLLYLALAASVLLILQEKFPKLRRGSGIRHGLAVAVATLAILYANPRGDVAGFQAAGFAAAVFPLGAVALMRYRQHALVGGILYRVAISGMLVLSFGTAFGISNRLALSTPHDLRIAHRSATLDEPLRVDPELTRLVRRLVPEGRPFQALLFAPDIYVAVGRSPASAYYFYLPWLAAYERNPVPGYSSDLCADLYRSQPRAIYYDAWRVWNRYDPAEFAPCTHGFVRDNHVAIRTVGHLYASIAAVADHPWILALANPRSDECLGRIGQGCTARRQAERAVQIETGRLVTANGLCLSAPDTLAAQVDVPATSSCNDPGARWQSLRYEDGGYLLVDRTGARCLERAEGPRVSPSLAPCTGAQSQRFARLPGPDGDLRFGWNGRCVGGAARGSVPCAEAAVWRADPVRREDPMAAWEDWIYPPMGRQ